MVAWFERETKKIEKKVAKQDCNVDSPISGNLRFRITNVVKIERP